MMVGMESYSMDLRERVVRACDEQIGTRMEIAEMFAVSTAWIRRLLQRRRETGGFSARPRGGRRFAAFDEAGLGPSEVCAAGATRRNPSRVAGPLRGAGQPHGRASGPARAGMSSKKKSLHAAEQDRPDVIAQRDAWRKKSQDVDPDRLVFLDESGAKTNMTRLYGRAFDGQRVVDSTPHGHWCTTTMVSSLRLDGTTAAMVIESPTDADVFEAYVGQVLAPTLGPGDIVIMDRLGPHKVPRIVHRIEATGAVVWLLPPYSPDFNPIEKMWSKIKEFLRSAKPRTYPALMKAIAQALKTVTDDDAQGWFGSCGYRYN
jgi:transposase